MSPDLPHLQPVFVQPTAVATSPTEVAQGRLETARFPTRASNKPLQPEVHPDAVTGKSIDDDELTRISSSHNQRRTESQLGDSPRYYYLSKIVEVFVCSWSEVE